MLYSAGALLVLGLFAIATRAHGWVLIPLIIAMFTVLLVIRVDQFDRWISTSRRGCGSARIVPTARYVPLSRRSPGAIHHQSAAADILDLCAGDSAWHRPRATREAGRGARSLSA